MISHAGRKEQGKSFDNAHDIDTASAWFYHTVLCLYISKIHVI